MAKSAALFSVGTGREYVLGDITTIGRLRQCDIAVVDESVSRYHARIVRAGNEYVVEDLGSRNGTYVNGKRVKKRVTLSKGCRVGIGNVTFQFRSEVSGGREVVAPGLVSIVDDSKAPVVQFQLTLPARECRLLPREVDSIDGATELLQKVERTMSLGLRLRGIQSSDALIEELAKQVIDSFDSADRCIIALSQGEEGNLFISGDYRRNPEDREAIHIGKSIIDGVLKEGKSGILPEDASGKKRALMCASLALPDRAVGVIYVEARPEASFGQEELELLTAFANEVAPNVEMLRLYETARKERDRLRMENVGLKRENDQYSFARIVGSSEAVKQAIAEARNATTLDHPVLIVGQPGTGRQFFAEVIHYNSKRRSGPFVVTNCYAGEERKLRSELLGTESRDANGNPIIKKGAIELANGGTLFISDVELMPMPLQTAFLDILENKQIQRIGGRRLINVDVRLIASTSASLKDMAAKGKFNDAFFYRLNVITIRLPSLPERKADIPLLAQHFLHTFCAEMNKELKGISEQAKAFMTLYSWPHNVRELKNLIERLVIKNPAGSVIEHGQLPSDMRDLGVPGQAKGKAAGISDSSARLEKQVIEETLRHCNRNKEEAARALGLTTTSLEEKLRRYGIVA